MEEGRRHLRGKKVGKERSESKNEGQRREILEKWEIRRKRKTEAKAKEKNSN